jgi:hypothetical protein
MTPEREVPSPIKRLSLFLALGLILFGVAMSLIRGSFYVNSYDPDYHYFLNGLHMAMGRDPGFVNHPGIPTQLLATVMLLIARPIHALFIGGSFDSWAVAHEEQFLWGLTLLQLFCTAWALAWAVRRIAQILGERAAQLFAAGFFAAGTSVFYTLLYFKPEPTIVLLAIIFSVKSLELMQNPTIKGGFFVGALVGLMITSKLSAFPFLLAVLFAMGWRARLAWLVGFGVSLVPTWLAVGPHLQEFKQWAVRLVTRSGRLGSGEGSVKATELFESAVWMFRVSPLLFLIPIVVLAVSRQKIKEDGATTKYLREFGVLLFAAGLALASVIKVPSATYTVPGLMLCVLLSALLGSSVSEKFSRRLIIFLVGLGLVVSVPSVTLVARDESAKRQEVVEIEKVLASQPKCRVAHFFPSPQRAYALAFGNEFSRRYYMETLNTLEPLALQFDIWWQTFRSFKAVDENASIKSDLIAGRCVLLVGRNFKGSDRELYFRTLNRETLWEGFNFGVYKLLGFKEL